MDIDLRLEPRKVAWTLSGVILGLDAAYIITQFPVRVLGWSHRNILIAAFDLNREYNLPTLYSVAALLLCALMLAMTAQGERRRSRPFAGWAGLSLAFAFLALDEMLVLHEKLNEPLRSALNTSGGVFHYAWVLPYAVMTAAFAAVYLPFLLRLPARTRNLFVLAGAIFVAGAAGCEMIGSLLLKDAPPKSVAMGLEILLEETLEMGGVVLFLYALLSHMRAELPGLRVSEASRGTR